MISIFRSYTDCKEMEYFKEVIDSGWCGISFKLQEEGGVFRDFYIKEESANDFPNFVNLIGIESPGLTASLAIAEYVKKILNNFEI